MTKHANVEVSGQTVKTCLIKQLIQAAEHAYACPHVSYAAVQTNKTSPFKHENKRNVLSFDRMFDGLQILSNTIKNDQTAPNKVFKRLNVLSPNNV